MIYNQSCITKKLIVKIVNIYCEIFFATLFVLLLIKLLVNHSLVSGLKFFSFWLLISKTIDTHC